MYEYHRIILDQFAEDPDGARTQIVSILKEIQKVQNINRNRVLIIAFFDAKADEIVNIFKDGDLQVRKEAYDLLVDIQPSRTSKFEEIINN